jgi:hypothetical protein
VRLLAFINHSTQITDEHVAAMAEACTFQLVQHVCTPWGKPSTFCFARRIDDVYGLDWVPRLVFFDAADQANTLGYHSVGPDGVPYGKVFVDEVFRYGGGILRDNGNGSVSVTASHEGVETVGDELVDQWVKGPAVLEGDEYAVELADQVQACSYEVPTRRAGLISVSNFIYPAALGLNSPTHTKHPFDYLGKLSAPFSAAPGGYQIVRNAAGHVSNVFGCSRFTSHEASRQARRQGAQR